MRLVENLNWNKDGSIVEDENYEKLEQFCQGIDISKDVLKIVSKSATTMQDIGTIIDACSKFETLQKVSTDTIHALEGIKANCTDTSLRLALDTVITAYQDGLNDTLEGFVYGSAEVGSDILKKTLNSGWKKLMTSNPALASIYAGQKLGTMISNLLANTDATSSRYYIAALDMFFNIQYVGLKHAENFVDKADSSVAGHIASWFNNPYDTVKS